MSKAFRDKFGYNFVDREEMREFLRPEPPERDSKGRIKYLTEQSHKTKADVNEIIRRYQNTGLIDHVSQFEAMFGDLGELDFRDALDRLNSVSAKFMEFPADFRAKFKNDPGIMLDWFDNPANKDEALRRGWARSSWTFEKDAVKPDSGGSSGSEGES